MREAVIDVEAIADNVRHFRRLTGVEVMAVVKADGYGHGAFRSAVAALQGGATRLGVADVAEAQQLRRAGVSAPILAWLHAPGTDFAPAVAAGIDLAVSSLDQLDAVAAAARGDRPAVVHVKVDTGLSRNGTPPAEWTRLFAEAARLERIGRIRVDGVFSHLSNASEADDRAALTVFDETLALAASAGLRPPLRHIAATHAAIALPEARHTCVRVGVGIYGLSPFADRSSGELGLRPAMTLRAAVAAVRRVPAGTGVSYGYDYRAERETTLALVPLGYADGVPRQASGAGRVRIDGREGRVAGRIAMDQFVVDMGDAPVSVGDEAVLFGDPSLGVPSATDWADAAGTINYEIVTRIGPRVPRRQVG
ncbi:alanine racemase [Microbacterium sp. NPDC091313]